MLLLMSWACERDRTLRHKLAGVKGSNKVNAPVQLHSAIHSVPLLEFNAIHFQIWAQL
jgi:hypothetical protein